MDLNFKKDVKSTISNVDCTWYLCAHQSGSSDMHTHTHTRKYEFFIKELYIILGYKNIRFFDIRI